MNIKSINYLSDWAEVNPLNDNIDINIVLEDERRYTFVVATPNNVFLCMENEGKDYFFGEPMLFVKSLTVENIERAIKAIVDEEDGRWLAIYG